MKKMKAVHLIVIAIAIAVALPAQAAKIKNKDIAKNAGISYSKLSLKGKIKSKDIKNGTVDTEDIADGAITADKLADDAFAAVIVDNTVTSAKIVNGTIVNADISDTAAIDGTKIDPDFGTQAVTTSGNISTTGTGTITSAGIANLDGGINVNSGVFTVDATTGDTTMNGPDRHATLLLDNDGDINVEGNTTLGSSKYDNVVVNARLYGPEGGTVLVGRYENPNDFGVWGATDAHGGLNVGDSWNNNDLTVNGDSTFNGDLTVYNGDEEQNVFAVDVATGDTTITGIDRHAELYLANDGDINVEGDSILGSSYHDNVTVNGTPTFYGDGITMQAADRHAELYLANDGDINVEGNSTLGSSAWDTLTVNADATFNGDLNGNLTGNVSGTAATVTGAAQTAITSVGTLTGLTMGGDIAMGTNNITGVGDIAVNGGDITSTAATMTIDPAGSGNVNPGADSTDSLGADATRWSTIYADTLNYATALTDANTAGTTVSMGDDSAADTVNITANTAITDGQWSVSNVGAAAFASATVGGVNVVTAGTGTGNVNSTMILDGTITADDLAANSVDSSEIAANAVDSSEIATDAVGSAEIASQAVGNGELADDAVTSSKIYNGTITGSDLATNIALSTTGAVDFSGAASINFGAKDITTTGDVTATNVKAGKFKSGSEEGITGTFTDGGCTMTVTGGIITTKGGGC